MQTRVVIVGAAGRMGQALMRAAGDLPQIRIVAAIASVESVSLGRDAGELAGCKPNGIEVTSDLASALAAADVVIDFSKPQATRAHVAACRVARKALLIGTTGVGPWVDEAELDAAAREMPLLIAPNTSVGVALLMQLVRTAARALPPQFDIEIVESHHRMKRDAPSGTALALAQAASEGRGASHAGGPTVATAVRTGPRGQGEIGIAVVRGGDIVGEHTVLFAGISEQLSLSHRATDRAIFASGALKAALWLAGRAPGRYSMSDFVQSNHSLG